MTPKWDDEAQKPLLFSLTDDQKRDTTVWTEVVGTGGSAWDAPMDGISDPPPPLLLSLNSSAWLMVESLWLLVWSSVHCYKERYASDPTSPKHASADPDFTSGLSTAGESSKRSKRSCGVVSRWWMEWCISRSIKESGCGRTPPQWGPVKHAKGTGPSRGTRCGIAPTWSEGTWRPSRWTRHQCYNG